MQSYSSTNVWKGTIVSQLWRPMHGHAVRTKWYPYEFDLSDDDRSSKCLVAHHVPRAYLDHATVPISDTLWWPVRSLAQRSDSCFMDRRPTGPADCLETARVSNHKEVVTNMLNQKMTSVQEAHVT